MSELELSEKDKDRIKSDIRLTLILKVELTRLSKTLLFISQDNENLLEKVEREND